MSYVLTDLQAGRDPCHHHKTVHLLLALVCVGTDTIPSLLRRAIRSALGALAYPATVIDDIEYAVNELVTNCVVHAPGSLVRVRLIENPLTHTLTCIVCDDRPGLPVIRTDTEQLRESGYGLASVAALAGRVENWACTHGTAVGFEYAVSA